jgi:hypothetical protein
MDARRCPVIETATRDHSRAQDDTKLSVLNPMGYPPRVTPKDMAPRLDTLEGKRVYLVDCRFDDADIFLKQMHAWFEEHLPGVQAELIRLSSVYTRDDPATWEKIKANGDAAIVGVGH